MKIGMVGMGKMGMNMSRRLIQGGHSIVAYDRSKEKLKEIKKYKAATAYSLDDLAKLLKPPRVVWLMIPAGKAVDETIDQLQNILQKGDTIIDGGNSFYKDDIRHERQLQASGINYLDIGVSGGVWGLKEGYCLMAGGDKKVYKKIEPVLKTLALKDGYLYCGTAGAGHFVKMVHNGIEYGLMAAYGEGFEILHSSSYGKDLNPADVAHLWNRGSVVRSWLLELAEDAFRKDKDLSGIEGYVEDSGEGRWTVQQAIDTSVPAPITALSLFNRFSSRQSASFSVKLLAALRNEFGGHAVVKRKKRISRRFHR
ncbi:MAG: decarboxylating 6-phosphogluconate dehydrogenase [Nitrospirae bacterium]|nr:decarboxylating 6-phosphogluconate dehydrogenase [Nitrospirota bacterium]